MRLGSWCFLLLSLGLPATVDAQSSQFNYTVNPDLTVTITKYVGPGGAVTVPATINGLPVTTIGASAFYWAGVTNIVLPNSITSIGDSAFMRSTVNTVTLGNGLTNIGPAAFDSCFSLTSCSIPDSVTSVGGLLFHYCQNLTNVTLGNGLQNTTNNSTFAECINLLTIGVGTNFTTFASDDFYHCISLRALNVDVRNPYLSSANGVLFDKNLQTLIFYPNAAGVTYTVPSSVTKIADLAFRNCSKLAAVTIPASVTSIGSIAFQGCVSLGSVTIPNSTLGVSVFESCSSLTNVILANDVTSIGSSEFRSCTSLASINIPNSVTNIGDSAFVGCTSLTSINIPDSVSSVEAGAFGLCSGLTNVTIGKGVTSIGSSAFESCPDLTGVFFQGNAPAADSTVFGNDNLAIVYYLPGTIGWGTSFSGRPALPITFQIQAGDASFGVRTNQFGFNITGSYGLMVVVEATSDLNHPAWTALQTNTLTGPSYFADPQWTNYPNRFYRLRWP